MYFLLGISLIFALLLVLNVAASAAATVLWRVVSARAEKKLVSPPPRSFYFRAPRSAVRRRARLRRGVSAARVSFIRAVFFDRNRRL